MIIRARSSKLSPRWPGSFADAAVTFATYTARESFPVGILGKNETNTANGRIWDTMENKLATLRRETIETVDDAGKAVRIVCEYGFDGAFAARHRQLPHLSVTVRQYFRTDAGIWRDDVSGACHDIVRRYLPHLADLCTFHLCTSAGPMHYAEDAAFLAGTADHWGLERGEFRQHVDAQGRPAWCLVVVGAEEDGSAAVHDLAREVHYGEKPEEPRRLVWVPYGRTGKGKARDLDAARVCACWPDATDAELSAPPAELRATLEARLPALLARFRAVCAAAGCPVPNDDGTEARE